MAAEQPEFCHYPGRVGSLRSGNRKCLMRRVLHPVATWRWVAGWLLLGLLLGSGAALAQTVPGLPTITKVTPGSGSLHITWDAPSDTGGSAITTYDLYYISNGYRYEGTVTVDAGVLEYTLSGLLDDWQYGVQVRAHNATGAGAWSDVTPTRTADHSDARPTATPLPLDSAVLGYISSGSDVDYFTIEPAAATEIHVRTYSGIDTVGQLLDSNGNVLTQNNDGNIDFFRNPKDFSLVYALTAGTTYYLKVSARGSATGFYTLQTETTTDHGNDRATAAALPLNRTVKGAITSSSDVDYFTIDLSATTDITIRTTGGLDTVGQVLDSNGNLIAENNDDVIGRNNFFLARSLPTDTYYIKVSGHAGATGFYSLKTGTGKDTAGPADAAELTITPQVHRDTAGGLLAPAGDVDYFRIELPAAADLVIRGIAALTLAPQLRLVGELLDSNSMSIATAAPSAGKDFLLQRRLEAGVYYLKVRGATDRQTGLYEVEVAVDFVVVTVDNSDAVEGTPISFTVQLSAPAPADIVLDWHVSDIRVGTATAGVDYPANQSGSVTIPAGESTRTITVQTTDDTAIEPNETLLLFVTTNSLPFGVVILDVDTEGALGTILDDDRSSTTTGGSGGGSGGGGEDSRDQHGNTPAQAARVRLGESAPWASSTAGQINTADDIDYFQFVLPRAGVLVVETTGSTATMGTIWQAGEELARADSGGVQRNFFLRTRVVAGTVVVAVEGNGSRTGDYTLETRLLVGYLENPGADSFQSGVGLLSGWVCEADTVELVLNDTLRQDAAYGTARLDTQTACGDTDNGFGLLFNWNLLGAGAHSVVALVDGVELDRATVTVTTLGEEFVRDVAGTCEAEDFPATGATVTLVWQETGQNFVIAGPTPPTGENRTGVAGLGYLENPGPNSFQSGIGVISGWVCAADEVEIVLNDTLRQPAAYGTERVDTQTACGDTDNGFGLLFNWNLLGEGEHTVEAVVDGEPLGWATVWVTTVGTGAEEEFLRGAEGECLVEDFPGRGQRVLLEWQQNSQNFVVTDIE